MCAYWSIILKIEDIEVIKGCVCQASPISDDANIGGAD
jgi:hypothetical protein